MPSNTALGAINAQNTGEVFLTLLTLTHPSMPVDLHFVNNFTNVTSNGVVFVAWPFDLPFPETGSDSLPTLTLTIDNVDQSIATAIMGITTPITVQLACVLASNPDQIEVGPLVLRIRSTEISMQQITAVLVFEDLLNEPFPYETYVPGNAPGLF
jgi:hypothetical protein